MAERAGADVAKIQMWRETDVPDPWYGDMSDFYETLDVIEAGADRIISEL